MYRSIVVGYDGSDNAKDALALARALAAEDARIVLTAVAPWSPRTPPDLPGRYETGLARMVAEAAAQHGCRSETIQSLSPARGLMARAEEVGAGLAVVGSSRRGEVGKALAGTVGRGLLNGASCAVAVAPGGFRKRKDGLNTIGVGLDGYPESELALDAAIELASTKGAALRLFAVLDPVGLASAWGYAFEAQIDAARERLNTVLDEADRRVPDDVDSRSELLEGSVAHSLIAASEDLDLLVAGSRGYGPIKRLVVGSTSAQLVETAQCAVLVTPRGTGASGSPPAERAVDTRAA